MRVLVNRRFSDERRHVAAFGGDLVRTVVHRREVLDVDLSARLADGRDLDVEAAGDREVRVPVVVVYSHVTDLRGHDRNCSKTANESDGRGHSRECNHGRHADPSETLLPSPQTLGFTQHDRNCILSLPTTEGRPTMQENGIIMNGVTGRMGTNQHLIRSICSIREEGGVELPSGERVLPEPVLVGRNERKLRELSEEHGVERYVADPNLETVLDGDEEIYFDSQITSLRADCVEKAVKAGKDIYCEKPLADDLETARAVAETAEANDSKHGIVQDKLWLPGVMKLQRLIDQGFFGDILSV